MFSAKDSGFNQTKSILTAFSIKSLYFCITFIGIVWPPSNGTKSTLRGICEFNLLQVLGNRPDRKLTRYQEHPLGFHVIIHSWNKE